MSRPPSTARIVGRSVPALVPHNGAVYVLLIGEAPGPRGADKSGVPFFGDAAGRHLYEVLATLGAVTVPDAVASLPWDGGVFRDAGLHPEPHGIALGNAFDRCPTNDGIAFRAPSRAELEGADNVQRLAGEISALSTRGLRGVITLGRVATRTIDVVFAHHAFPALQRRALPHPSAQGLLSMHPERGRGAKMTELQEAWKARCGALILEIGYPDPSTHLPA